jgi:hypothetical protein
MRIVKKKLEHFSMPISSFILILKIKQKVLAQRGSANGLTILNSHQIQLSLQREKQNGNGQIGPLSR